MKPTTLFDAVYRLSFKNKLVNGWRSNADMRHALQSTRRFVADDAMGSFMADLANEAFLKHQGTGFNVKICDSLRVQSRLPHEAVWIEYPLRAYQARSHEIRGMPPIVPSEIPAVEGWLIQQHPKLDTACVMHLFTSSEFPDEKGYDTWTFPFSFGWSCDDTPMPWRDVILNTVDEDTFSSEFLVGMRGYKTRSTGVVRSSLIDDPSPIYQEVYVNMLREWTGIIRRVWSLLATIDNLPLSFGTTRTPKGFLAQHRIRPYLEHQTITLSIPARTRTKVLARRLIAMAHRKRHEVRGHWRDDWRNPPGKCRPHVWECVGEDSDTIECTGCRGRQIYVHKHERGDASIGYVTHDYRLKHEA